MSLGDVVCYCPGGVMLQVLCAHRKICKGPVCVEGLTGDTLLSYLPRDENGREDFYLE